MTQEKARLWRLEVRVEEHVSKCTSRADSEEVWMDEEKRERG